MQGIRTWQNNENNKFFVLRLHYTADEDKRDPAWNAAMRAECPSEAIYQMEYEINYSALEGTRYFPKFQLNPHVKEVYKEYYDKGKNVLRGWDFGRLAPAVTFDQISNNDVFLIMKEIVGDNIIISDFAQNVIEFSDKYFPNVKFEDYGDIAGTHRGSTSNKTDVQILKDFGINVHCKFSKSVEKSLELIDQRLETPQGELILVDSSCTYTIDALSSEYRWNKQGTAPLSPNHPYEDVIDTIRYVMEHKFKIRDLTRKTRKARKTPVRRIISSLTGY